MKIRNKLVIALAIATTTILSLLSFVLISVVTSNMEERIYQDMDTNLNNAAGLVNATAQASIKNYLRGKCEQVQGLIEYQANQPEVSSNNRSITIDQQKALSSAFFSRIGYTGYITILDTTSTILSHPDKHRGETETSEVVRALIQIRSGYVESIDEQHDKTYCGYIITLRDLNIHIIAVAVKEELTSLIKIQDIREQLQSIKVGSSGYSFLMDKFGSMLIHPVLQGINSLNYLDANERPLFKDIIESSEETGIINYSWKDTPESPIREKTLKYQKLPTLGWTVVISTYRDEYFAIISVITIVIICGVILTILFMIGITYLLVGRITGSIGKLQRVFTDLAEGNLCASSTIQTKDEIQDMSGYCNSMARELHNSVQKIKQATDSSRSLSTDLASHSTEISATVNQISATMTSMSEGIGQLHSELKKSDSNLASIKTDILSVSELLNTQESSVNTSTEAVTALVSKIQLLEKNTKDKKTLSDNLSILAQQGEQKMTETVKSIKEVETYTGTILELIKVINSVASQTNLLAMNAAIEAAHAGEYGQGFSVVADEIRKLAETASQNAKNISGSLKSISGKIQQAVDQGNLTNKAFQEIIQGINTVSNGMTETMQGLKEMATGGNLIDDSMLHLKTISTRSHTSNTHMNESLNHIFESLKTIYGMIEHYLQSMQEVAQGSNEISDAMIELAELSNKNKDSISLLDEAVARFKLE